MEERWPVESMWHWKRVIWVDKTGRISVLHEDGGRKIEERTPVVLVSTLRSAFAGIPALTCDASVAE